MSCEYLPPPSHMQAIQREFAKPIPPISAPLPNGFERNLDINRIAETITQAIEQRIQETNARARLHAAQTANVTNVLDANPTDQIATDPTPETPSVPSIAPPEAGQAPKCTCGDPSKRDWLEKMRYGTVPKISDCLTPDTLPNWIIKPRFAIGWDKVVTDIFLGNKLFDQNQDGSAKTAIWMAAKGFNPPVFGDDKPTFAWFCFSENGKIGVWMGGTISDGNGIFYVAKDILKFTGIPAKPFEVIPSPTPLPTEPPPGQNQKGLEVPPFCEGAAGLIVIIITLPFIKKSIVIWREKRSEKMIDDRLNGNDFERSLSQNDRMTKPRRYHK
jgi:hypothetical protein